MAARYFCVFLFVWFLISMNFVDALRCHPGWTLQKNSCYSYGESPVSWTNAQEFCRLYGGRLAEIETADENTFVINLIKPKQSGQVWIGGTDILNEGHWEWIYTGEVFKFTDWAPNQPDEYGGGEDCLQYQGNGGTYMWNDSPCDQKYNFVCEAEPVN